MFDNEKVRFRVTVIEENLQRWSLQQAAGFFGASYLRAAASGQIRGSVFRCSVLHYS